MRLAVLIVARHSKHHVTGERCVCPAALAFPHTEATIRECCQSGHPQAQTKTLAVRGAYQLDFAYPVRFVHQSQLLKNDSKLS